MKKGEKEEFDERYYPKINVVQLPDHKRGPYFCTPCKAEFKKEKDLDKHLTLRSHRKKLRYAKKVFKRRTLGNWDDPVSMSDTSSSADEWDKYERDLTIRNYYCEHKGFGFKCRKCAKKRNKEDLQENYDPEKISKRMDDLYKEMVTKYGEDPSPPSSVGSEPSVFDELFSRMDPLMLNPEEIINKKSSTKSDTKEDTAIDEEEEMSRFMESLADPESGYENAMPRMETEEEEEEQNVGSEHGPEEEDLNIEDDDGVLFNFDELKGEVRYLRDHIDKQYPFTD